MSQQLPYGSVEINIDDTLGMGSYGKVCKGKCGQLPSAAKLLHDTMFLFDDPGIHSLTRRFEQECRFLSTIKHPNIVQCLGTITNPDSGRPVLLMELMDESLTKFLERSSGPLQYHTQVNICYDVALALSYLHFNGIIHRDLSSNNVLLIGAGIRAKVTDFGMSKLMDMNPQMTPLTHCPGTSAYMPPEALSTPPNYSSKLDCFSHGVLIIQVITKNFPNPGDANMYVTDPKYPTGRVLVQFPEIDRRKEDIDLIENDHPLLPIALHCIKDWERERPSADELCERLALLKTGARYTHSVDQSNVSLVQRLQSDLQTKNQEIQEYQRELVRKEEVYQREQTEKEEAHKELERKAEEYQKELEAKVQAIQGKAKEYERELEEKKQVIQTCDRRNGKGVQIEEHDQVQENEKERSLYKKREDYNNDGDYGKYVKSTLKPGMRVRALYDYDSIVKGNIGIYKRCSLFAPPPAQVAWAELEGKTSWVHWHMVEILPPSTDCASIVHRRNQEKMETPKEIPVSDQPEKVESHPVSMKWRQGEPAPEEMVSLWGAAVVHSNFVYFSSRNNIYSYEPIYDEWAKLQPSPHCYFSLAIVNDKLTTIGGEDLTMYNYALTNALLSLTGSGTKMKWKQLLPSMPTKRSSPASVTTTTHLVVAGGKGTKQHTFRHHLSTVEVLNTENLQWWTACSTPVPIGFPSMILCNGYLYISTEGGTVYSSSMESLLQSSDNLSRNVQSAWNKLADVSYDSKCASLGGHVFAIGGECGLKPLGTIQCYDIDTNSWNVISEMPTPRYNVLTAVLPSNELMVVGGCNGKWSRLCTTEIGQIENY